MDRAPIVHNVHELAVEFVKIEDYYDGPLSGVARYDGRLYSFELSEDCNPQEEDEWWYTLTPLDEDAR